MAVYAVTGASGHLGRVAVQELLNRDVPASHIVAIVRTQGRSRTLRREACRCARRIMRARKPWVPRWAV
jgi:uncharacterized protein YbjT (DUF2867 family)